MSKNFELLEQTNNKRDLFQTSLNTTTPAATADYQCHPAEGAEVHRRLLKRTTFPSRWIDLIKEEARSWAPQRQAEKNPPRADLEAMAREEEIKLVQRVFRAEVRHSPHVALFSSVEGEAGCATICAHVSEILAAQSEEPVCLVDANFRSPSLHEYFGLDNSKGLAEALLEAGPIQEFAQQLGGCNLSVMPTGFGAEQLSHPLLSERLRSRITELRTQFRYVIVRASPLNLDTNSILLGRWTDGVVLVVEANITRRDTARRVKENLEAANVPVLGVVLNHRTFPIPEALYRRF
jgi:protein-tyrosine kinase